LDEIQNYSKVKKPENTPVIASNWMPLGPTSDIGAPRVVYGEVQMVAVEAINTGMYFIDIKSNDVHIKKKVIIQ
jgi:hypothetical protein